MRRWLLMSWLALAGGSLAAGPARGAEPAAPPTADGQQERLQAARQELAALGVADTPAALHAYLATSLVTPERQRQLDRWLRELGSGTFRLREAASAQLEAAGVAAIAGLTRARNSSDPEVAQRARVLLQRLQSAAAREAAIAGRTAALRLLRQHRHRATPRLLLQLDNVFNTIAEQELAAEALWACVTAEHRGLLREAIAGKRPRVSANRPPVDGPISEPGEETNAETSAETSAEADPGAAPLALAAQAAALVGLELTGEPQDLDRIRQFLVLPGAGRAAGSSQLALAACRALIDREPRQVAQLLSALLGDEDATVAAHAETLLKLQLGYPVDDAAGVPQTGVPPAASRPPGWPTWNASDWTLAKVTAARLSPVGQQRLDLTLSRVRFAERFRRAEPDVSRRGYGRLRYQSTLPAPRGNPPGQPQALVADGVLRLRGTHDECDQRVALAAEDWLGRKRLPQALTVTAQLAAQAGNNFGWHLGVSVGSVKVLFHPGVEGGAFRAESRDGHDYLFPNQAMGFTPQPGQFYQFQLQLRPDGRGARIDVRIQPADGPGDAPPAFRRSFTVTAQQLGEFDQIGLERSGRSGGAALFRSLHVTRDAR